MFMEIFRFNDKTVFDIQSKNRLNSSKILLKKYRTYFQFSRVNFDHLCRTLTYSSNGEKQRLRLCQKSNKLLHRLIKSKLGHLESSSSMKTNERLTFNPDQTFGGFTDEGSENRVRREITTTTEVESFNQAYCKQRHPFDLRSIHKMALTKF